MVAAIMHAKNMSVLQELAAMSSDAKTSLKEMANSYQMGSWPGMRWPENLGAQGHGEELTLIRHFPELDLGNEAVLLHPKPGWHYAGQ